MKRQQSVDYIIFTATALLMILGLAALASASSDLGKIKFDDAYYYLKHQALYGLTFGLLGFGLGRFINYRIYKRLAMLFLLVSIVALVLAFSPLGFSSGGARRWIQLGPVTIQPSELLKLFFIGYLAAWLSSPRAERHRSVGEGFLPFLIISGVIGILLLWQRSTSAAIILMLAALTVYFVSGARKKYIILFILVSAGFLSAVIVATPYRLERIKSFLDPQSVGEESTYQQSQALITIGSGGIKGVGYGQSNSKAYLPERIGDSIFAIIAEEFGFIGSVVIIALFFVLVMRIFVLAKRCGDQFGRLLLTGFGTIIGIQAFVHIGANSGLIPLTGVPLPFISFGGTSLAVFLTMTGVILNISKSAKR